MTYKNASILLQMQDRSIRKIDGIRFINGDCEYRLMYRGGFAPYVGLDRRKIGKRNFKYFGGFGAAHCWTISDIFDLVQKEIEKREI